MAQKDVILYLPTPAEIATEARLLDVSYNKANLIDEIGRIKSTLESVSKIRYCNSLGQISDKRPPEFDGLFRKSISAFTKSEVATILAAFTADRRNRETEISLWPANRKALIYTTAQNGVCSQFQMDSALELKHTDKHHNYRYTYDRVSSRYVNSTPLITWLEYSKIDSRGQLYDPTSTIFGALPRDWHLKIFEIIYPNIYRPFPSITDSEIADKHLTHVNLESQIANALSYLVQAYRSNTITSAASRIVSKKDLKKIKSAPLNMDPFPDGPYRQQLDGYFAQALTVHFFNALSVVPHNTGPMPDGMTIVHRMFQNTDKIYDVQLLEIMLPHLSGFKASTLPKFKYRPYISRIKELLEANGTTWLDVQSLKHKVYHHAIARQEPLLIEYGIESASLHSVIINQSIKAPTQNVNVMYPFIEGFLAQLMAMGLLEGMFASFDQNTHSYFGALQYVRLTEMGKAAFGLTRGYTLQLMDKYVGQYDLVDGPLLVYSRVENNPNDKVLQDIATKTGRYWNVTTQSFLQHCNSTSDILKNISTFKQTICNKPPKAWQQFFKSIQTKAADTPTRDHTSWVIMNISPQDTQLQQLLCTDPFRNIVVRAEGHRILIKRQDMPQYIQLMRAHGYLID